jgi:hypothetical protein
MPPDPTSLDPLDPGRMTVPPLFGWEQIVLVLALVAIVGVAFLLHSVARGSANGRSDWQSWLDARSARLTYPAGAAHDRAVDRIHPSRLVLPIAPDDDVQRHQGTPDGERADRLGSQR